MSRTILLVSLWHIKCTIYNGTHKKGGCDMEKGRKSWLVGLTSGLMILMATPAFAKSISMKDAGVTLWIFVIIGTVIVLLQLIPAAILFFSFIGTATTAALKKEKTAEEEVVLPGAEPVAVKK